MGKVVGSLWARLRSSTARGSTARGWSLADPAPRRRAALHYQIADHAILRHRWTNMDQVAPGVWRSNHPTHARLRALKAIGTRTILNLRGPKETPAFLFERESCEALDLRLVSVSLHARRAPKRAELLTLLDAFRTVERPFLMHCKSGADRAGFASAPYLLAHGATVAEARRQLSWRYLHVRASRTGVLDDLLDRFAARQAEGAIGIEAWDRGEYDEAALTGRQRRS